MVMEENIEMNETLRQDIQIQRGISGSTLKFIAMLTMLIDHIGATIVLQFVQRNSDNFDALGNVRMTGMVVLYYVLRGIGRLAFPIFIFLLLEGFQYTHNRFRYIGRLLLFAILSEIPFDLAVNLSVKWILKGHFLEFTSQNVFFTLAIGMIVLTVLEGLRALQMDTILKAVLIVGVAALGAALAYALHTDYGAVGVLAICTAYGFRNQKKELRMAAPCVILSILNMSELYALVDAGIAHFYNGKRGLKLKWVFYIFYPLHLLILAGICVLLFK